MPVHPLRLILLGAPLVACALSACSSAPPPRTSAAPSAAVRPAASPNANPNANPGAASVPRRDAAGLTTTPQAQTQATVVATPMTAPLNPIKPPPASAASAATPTAPSATRMPAVRLLLPHNPGDPTLMIDENGIARALPSQSKPQNGKAGQPATSPATAAAKPGAGDAAPAAVPGKVATTDAPPMPAATAATKPPAASATTPSTVPAAAGSAAAPVAPAAAPATTVADRKPATPAATAMAPSAASTTASTATRPVPTATAAPTAAATPASPRLGEISDDERRRLSSMPLPQLPILAARPPAETAAAPAAAPQPVAPSAGIGPGEVASVDAEFAKVSDRIGLGDEQLRQIAEAKALADTGQESAALAALIGLNHELDEAYASYTVQHGEALRQIAAKPEVYGNANLWPLIRDANRATLPDPARLAEGQKLRVPRYPSATAAARAIEQARNAKPQGAP